MKSMIKRLFLGEGRNPRRIPLGLYRGLTLSIDSGSESLFYFGLYEAETNPWLRRFIREAKSVVDVGAGCGELTMWALSKPGVERVLAYDASPSRWPVFRENLRLNKREKDERLTAVEDLFLGGEDAKDGGASLLAGLPGPILLKIDVDGGESYILDLMRPVLVQHRFLILLETHSRDLDDYCHRLLEEAGYRCRRIAPAWWRTMFGEQRPESFNQWIAAEPARG
jgi:hypothetical protein